MDQDSIVRLAGMLGSGYAISGESVQMACPATRFSTAHKALRDEHFSFGIKEGEPSICHCFTCGFGEKKTLRGAITWLFKKGGISRAIYDFVLASETLGLAGLCKRLSAREKYFEKAEPAVEARPDYSAFTRNRGADRYYKHRGITESEIEKYQLGYDPEKHRAFLPIISAATNEIVGGVGRTLFAKGIPKYYKYGKPTALFGEIFRKIEQRVTLVEGPFDAIVANRIFPNVLALNGTVLPRDQEDKIADWADSVNIFFDNDSAGITKAEKLAERLYRRMRVFMIFPPEGKDPSDCNTDELLRLQESKKIFHFPIDRK